METGKLIAYAVVGLVALAILNTLLPYLVLFLALVGGWHLYSQNQKR